MDAFEHPGCKARILLVCREFDSTRIRVELMAFIPAINEEKDSLTLAERVQARDGHHLTPCAKVGDAEEWLRERSPDLLIASGGRHGERAKETVGILKRAGIPGSKILLLTSPGSLAEISAALREDVHAVMPDTTD